MKSPTQSATVRDPHVEGMVDDSPSKTVVPVDYSNLFGEGRRHRLSICTHCLCTPLSVPDPDLMSYFVESA